MSEHPESQNSAEQAVRHPSPVTEGAGSNFLVTVNQGASCDLHLLPDLDDLDEDLVRMDAEDCVRYLYRLNPLPHVCKYCWPRRSASEEELYRELSRRADDVDGERVKEIVAEERAKFFTGRRVAIIGSGGTALVAAFDLASKGHGVVIYEAGRLPGGRMRSLVESGKMSGEELDWDIDVILSMGIDLRLNMQAGSNISLDKLNTNFDAVLDTTGSVEQAPDWMWSCRRCKDIRSAIDVAHRVAASIHDSLMVRYWKRA